MKNFGQIKNSFNTIISESIGSKNLINEATFKAYLKDLRENEILKTQFFIYKNIEDKVEISENKAIEFVKSNVALLDKFSKKEILEANKVLESKIPSSLECEIYPNPVIKTLHENISKLILTKKDFKTVDTIVEATIEIAKHINSNKGTLVSENIGIPNSLLASIAVDKFNDKYEDISESQKKAIKLIVESDETSREGFFKESIKECLTLINEKLKISDVTVKESLLSAKENLLGREFNDETFTNDISKILELSEDLK